MHFRALGILSLFLVGCSSAGRLGVEARAVASEKPGHVAAYLSVSENGAPARGLSARDFTVYENDLALSFEHTGQVLLDKNKVAAHHTLVLFDVSQASDADVQKDLQTAVAVFVDRVRATQSVSIYVYDGSPRIRFLAEYEADPKAKPIRLPTHLAVEPRDKSRDLYGAVLLGEKELERRLAARGKALRFGTLVVHASGPDLAGRGSRGETLTRLEKSPHRVLGISFGPGTSQVKEIGKDGFFDAHSREVTSMAFEEAAHAVRDLYDQEYVLAYCSPARSGERRLRIEARVTTEEGREKTGGVSSSFNADGFTGRCNPEHPPRFVSLAP